MDLIINIAIFLITAIVFTFVGIFVRKKIAESKLNSAENEAKQILDRAKIEAENNKKEELAKKVRFDFWEKYDEDHTVIRFATSWGTKMEDIDALIELL